MCVKILGGMKVGGKCNYCILLYEFRDVYSISHASVKYTKTHEAHKTVRLFLVLVVTRVNWVFLCGKW